MIHQTASPAQSDRLTASTRTENFDHDAALVAQTAARQAQYAAAALSPSGSHASEFSACVPGENYARNRRRNHRDDRDDDDDDDDDDADSTVDGRGSNNTEDEVELPPHACA